MEPGSQAKTTGHVHTQSGDDQLEGSGSEVPSTFTAVVWQHASLKQRDDLRQGVPSIVVWRPNAPAAAVPSTGSLGPPVRRRFMTCSTLWAL